MEEQTLLIDTFQKGINQSLDKQLIEPNEASYAQNCDVGDGNLSRSKGFIKYNNARSNNTITNLMRHYINNVAIVLAVYNDSIYKLENNSFVNLGSGYSTSHKHDYINYQIGTNETTIFGNGVDNVKVYNGVTIKNLLNRRILYDEIKLITGYEDANGTVHPTEATVTTYAPKGRFMELHKERLWVSGDSSEPNRVYFSKDFDPHDWTAPIEPEYANQHGGTIDVPTWDGGIIIGMKTLFDDIMVFKNRNAFRIFGTYPGNYSVQQVFNSVDSDIIDKTIASSENSVIWATTKGIFMFNGTNVTNISDKVAIEYIKTNKGAMKDAIGVIHNDKYILAIPTSGSIINNTIIELDLKNGGYMVRSGISVNSFLQINEKLLFTNAEGYIYEYGIGNTNDGVNINSAWQSGNMHFGYQNAKKNLYKVYFVGKGTGSIKISLITERKVVEKVVQLTGVENMYRIRIRNKGRLVSFKIENLNGCDFTIKQPQFTFEIDAD